MLNVSQAVKDKFQSDLCRKEIRITIGNTVLTNEAIYKDGFRLTESVMDGAVEFVGCIASILEFKVSTLSLAKGNYRGQTVTAEVAVYLTDGTLSAYVPLFHGFVDECTKSADGYYQEFVCYDRLAYLSDEPGYNMYKAAFNGSSVDLETFRDAIVLDCDMDAVNSQVLPNDDIIFKKRKRNKDVTAMALLRHIAQINGTFGILNRDNRFEFRGIDDSADPEAVAYYRELTYSDHIVRPVGDPSVPTGSITIRTNSQDAGVTVDWTNYQQYAGTDPGWSDESQDTYLVDDDDEDVVVDSYIIEGNLIAYKLKKGKKQVIGANILASLGHDAVFREYSVKCNGLPYVECCDKVLFTKKDQSQIEFVVTKRVLEGVQNMTDTYSCTINAHDSNDKSFVSNVDNSTNSLGGSPNEALGLTEKTITENGTYSAMDDGAEGFSQVTVDVEGGGGESKEYYYPSTDVTPSGYSFPRFSYRNMQCYHNGKYYAVGLAGQLYVFENDIWNQKGTVIPGLSSTSWVCALKSFSGKLWAFGYMTSDSYMYPEYYHYDFSNNTWIDDGWMYFEQESIRTYINLIAGPSTCICEHQNRLHFFGVYCGTYGSGQRRNWQNKFHAYFDGENWGQYANSCPIYPSRASAVTYKGKIHIIGAGDQYLGWDTNKHLTWESSDIYAQLPDMQVTAENSCSFVIDNEIHTFGDDTQYVDQHIIYNGTCWKQDEHIIHYDYAQSMTPSEGFSADHLNGYIDNGILHLFHLYTNLQRIWTIEKTEIPTS